jgi:hypothetical protein
MSLVDHPRFLHTVLLVDAATCVATGGLMSFGASVLSGVTRLPEALLFNAGLSLLPIAAFIGFVAASRRPIAAGVLIVILGNVGWVIGSLSLLVVGGLAPNVLGATFVVAQAIAVAVLAGLEVIGLKRMPVAA